MNDLSADLSAELAPPVGPPAPPVGPPAPPVGPPAPPVAWQRQRVPAVSVVFTPLHWSRPALAAPVGGAGVVLRGGPWQVDVLL